jgi:hypothetical protein
MDLHFDLLGRGHFVQAATVASGDAADEVRRCNTRTRSYAQRILDAPFSPGMTVLHFFIQARILEVAMALVEVESGRGRYAEQRRRIACRLSASYPK